MQKKLKSERLTAEERMKIEEDLLKAQKELRAIYFNELRNAIIPALNAFDELGRVGGVAFGAIVGGILDAVEAIQNNDITGAINGIGANAK